MTFSVGMFVKNEEEMIRGALESIKDADEIVVVDTGSTDRTLDIVREYTDKVYHFEWCDDFAAVKNFVISKLTGDWFMTLDADCRLEEGGIEKIREVIASSDQDALSMRLVWNSWENKDTKYHNLPKLFRRSAGITYTGKVHEVPNKLAQGESGVSILYLYSPNHRTDLDRNLRCLLQDDTTKPRTMFYLGREYFERKRYDEALYWLERYVLVSPWLPEKAEALLTIAKCYWYSGRGDKAREYGLKTVALNPDFKEALLFMGTTHFSPWKEKWENLAQVAKNRDVLFIRT